MKKGRVLIFFPSFLIASLVLYFFISGKLKKDNSPILKERVPNEKLAEIEEKVLGVVEEATSSNIPSKILEKTSGFFETSELTLPLRQVREIVIQRINETIESIKEIPEKEIKNIKKEVCKQWLEEE